MMGQGSWWNRFFQKVNERIRDLVGSVPSDVEEYHEYIEEWLLLSDVPQHIVEELRREVTGKKAFSVEEARKRWQEAIKLLVKRKRIKNTFALL